MTSSTTLLDFDWILSKSTHVDDKIIDGETIAILDCRNEITCRIKNALTFQKEMLHATAEDFAMTSSLSKTELALVKRRATAWWKKNIYNIIYQAPVAFLSDDNYRAIIGNIIEGVKNS